MTVEEFVKRLKDLIAISNVESTDGQNQLLLSQDDEMLLLDETTVENAVLRAKTINASFGVYADAAADPNTNVADFNDVDVSFGIANQQYGFIDPGSDYIGVTEDYEPPQGGTDFYTKSELVTIFGAKSVEEIAGIQADLVNAGLLDIGEFLPGRWDRNTQRAFAPILELSNTIGVTPEQKATGGRWKSVMSEYSANPIGAIKPEAVYLPPDYDAVTQQVKNVFRQQLDRDPKAYELQLLGDVLLAESKKAFALQQQLQEDISANVTSEELLDGTYGNHLTPQVAEGTTQISPGAALYEKFEEITKNERERLGTNRDIQATNRIILNSITGAPR